jgi:hypothetical protein
VADRQRYQQGGLEQALYERARLGTAALLMPRSDSAWLPWCAVRRRKGVAPKHDSWLNQAQIAISLFSRQVLRPTPDRRLSFSAQNSGLELSYESPSSSAVGIYSQEDPTHV